MMYGSGNTQTKLIHEGAAEVDDDSKENDKRKGEELWIQ